MYQHDKINVLMGGWYVVFKNGDVITEDEMNWSMVPNKKEIALMGLKWRHKAVELEGKESYVPPGETHIRDITIGTTSGVMITKPTVIGRFIGYYDVDCKVLYRLDINTGKVFEERVSYR